VPGSHSTPDDVPTSRRQWLTLAAVALGVFVTTLDNTIVNVALPTIQEDLHLGLAGLTWVVNGYILSFAVLLLTGGRLADSYGRRRLFLIGLGAFTGASLLAGLAPSAGTLIAARVLQGVGAALLTPPTLAIINHTFRDPRARGTAIGIWGAVAALAFAVGPILGGLITEHLHWSWVFFVNVPIGVAGLLAGMHVIPESTDATAPRRLDMPGLVVASATLFALTYALIKANDLGWGSATIVGLLAAVPVGVVAFVLIERRAQAPTVDLSLFRLPTFSGANVAILAFNLGTFGVFLYTSLYFQHVLGYSPVTAGAALLPWVVMLIVIGPFSGRLSERVAPNFLVAGGLAVMAAGLLLLTGIDEHSTYADLLPGLLIGGFGGALTITLNAVAIGAVPVERSGVASGIFNTARETGGSLGIAIIGAVLAAGQRGALTDGANAAHAFAAGYTNGILVAAGLALIAALVALVTLRAAPQKHAADGRRAAAAPGIVMPLADAP
jgi:EmrB/QacA subfamily drug resistance transporter